MVIGLARSVLVCALLTSPAGAKTFTLFAGSYTNGTSKGVYAWKFDSNDGALRPIGLVAETPQPAHIWISPSGRDLYAVNWETDGGVSAFRIDPQTARLSFLNRVSSHGALPNQVVLDPSGRIAVTTTYSGGTLAAFKVEPDGRLSDAFYVDPHVGPPLTSSQRGPKVHGAEFSKDGRFLYVADLGLDRVYVYRVDIAKPAVIPADPPFVNTHPAAGPRRLQLSRNGQFLYVDDETSSEVTVFAVNGARLKEVETVSTLPPGAHVKNMTAEIMIDRAGRHLYVGNRGEDTIAVFDIDPATGRLTLVQNASAGGLTPRNIRLDPTGAYLLSANEGSGSIAELKVDPATGKLSPTGVSVSIDRPGGLFFLPSP
jgi:6-phosphogluconolactonase